MGQTLRLFGFLLIVLLLPLTIFVIGRQQELRGRADPPPIEFLLSSDTTTVGTESATKVVLIAYARKEAINAVQVNITYPQSKLDLQAIDTSDSPFDQQTEQIADNGLIALARSTTIPQFGAKPIATLTFKASEPTATSEITVLSNSSVIKSADNSSVYPPSRFVDPSQIPGDEEGTKTVFDGVIRMNNEFWSWLLTKIPISL